MDHSALTFGDELTVDQMDVCAGLGEETVVVERDDDGVETERVAFVPGADAGECLKDIQRYLRRDDPRRRPFFFAMQQWRVVEKKLLPLFLASQDQRSLLNSVLKLLVVLTMPPPEETLSREKQNSVLRAYARLLIDGPVLRTLRSLLARHLKLGAEASDRDVRVVELLVSLIRNLLHVPSASAAPDAAAAASGDASAKARQSKCTASGPQPSAAADPAGAHVHEDVVVALNDCIALDALLLLARRIDDPNFQQLDLLMLDALYKLFSGVDAAAAARWASAGAEAGKGGGRTSSLPPPPPRGELRSAMARERRMRASQSRGAGRRHSRFSGSLVSLQDSLHDVMSGYQEDGEVVEGAGKSGVVGCTRHEGRVVHRVGGPALVGMRPEGRRRRRGQSDREAPRAPTESAANPAASALRATGFQRAGAKLTAQFVDKTAPRFMTRMKAELHSGKSRMLPSDQRQFLYLCWHLIRFQRHRMETEMETGKGGAGRVESSVRPVAPFLDLYSFQFVVKCCQVYSGAFPDVDKTLKDPAQLAVCCALLKEMVLVLHLTRLHSAHPKERELTTAILTTVFYERDIMDLAPRLLRTFDGRAVARSCLVDVVALVHALIRSMESFGGGVVMLTSRRAVARKKRKALTDEQVTAAKADASERADSGEGAGKQPSENVLDDEEGDQAAAATGESSAPGGDKDKGEAEGEASGTGEGGAAASGQEGGEEEKEKKEGGEEAKTEDEEAERRRQQEREEAEAAAEREQRSERDAEEREAERERVEQTVSTDDYVKEFTSDAVLRAYCLLVDHAASLSERTVRHVHAMLARVAAFKLEETPMEAALFRFPILLSFLAFADDPVSQHSQALSNLRAFCVSVCRHFLRGAASNPLLVVEALFARRPRDNRALYNHYDEYTADQVARRAAKREMKSGSEAAFIYAMSAARGEEADGGAIEGEAEMEGGGDEGEGEVATPWGEGGDATQQEGRRVAAAPSMKTKAERDMWSRALQSSAKQLVKRSPDQTRELLQWAALSVEQTASVRRPVEDRLTASVRQEVAASGEAAAAAARAKALQQKVKRAEAALEKGGSAPAPAPAEAPAPAPAKGEDEELDALLGDSDDEEDAPSGGGTLKKQGDQPDTAMDEEEEEEDKEEGQEVMTAARVEALREEAAQARKEATAQRDAEIEAMLGATEWAKNLPARETDTPLPRTPALPLPIVRAFLRATGLEEVEEGAEPGPDTALRCKVPAGWRAGALQVVSRALRTSLRALDRKRQREQSDGLERDEVQGGVSAVLARIAEERARRAAKQSSEQEGSEQQQDEDEGEEQPQPQQDATPPRASTASEESPPSRKRRRVRKLARVGTPGKGGRSDEDEDEAGEEGAEEDDAVLGEDGAVDGGDVPASVTPIRPARRGGLVVDSDSEEEGEEDGDAATGENAAEGIRQAATPEQDAADEGKGSESAAAASPARGASTSLPTPVSRHGPRAAHASPAPADEEEAEEVQPKAQASGRARRGYKRAAEDALAQLEEEDAGEEARAERGARAVRGAMPASKRARRPVGGRSVLEMDSDDEEEEEISAPEAPSGTVGSGWA